MFTSIGRRVCVLCALAIVGVRPAAAQGQSPEQAYQQGAKLIRANLEDVVVGELLSGIVLMQRAVEGGYSKGGMGYVLLGDAYRMLAGEEGTAEADRTAYRQKARDAYRQALKHVPLSDVGRKLADVLEELGDNEGAIAQYKSVVQSAPGDGLAHYALGLLLLGKGDAASAMTAFRAAVQALDRQSLSSYGATIVDELRANGYSAQADEIQALVNGRLK